MTSTEPAQGAPAPVPADAEAADAEAAGSGAAGSGAAGVPGTAGVPRPARRQSVRGIVLTMLVVGGMAVLLWSLFPRTSQNVLPAVDVGQAATGLEKGLGFAPAVPVPGPGWKATSTSAGPGVDGVQSWRVNYVTPAGSWVSLVQGGTPTRRWEGVQVIDGGEKGTATVAGRTFVIRARPDRQLTGYVLRDGQVTTMFVGKANPTEIEALIRATPIPAS